MDDTPITPCTHRWILGTPTLSKVSGVCRKCGAQRSYPSSLELFEAIPDYAAADRSSVVRSFEIASIGQQAAA